MNYKRSILLLGMGIVTASVSYGADDVTLPQAQNNYAAGPGAAVTNGNRAVAIGHLATAVDSGAVALGDAANKLQNLQEMEWLLVEVHGVHMITL